ncbi:MAG: protease modulator HflC [Alphaproteobacteria bacterium]|jgi:membrane protease subunit HflC|nr:protease modulator HflC [Alphaproteobacteria bacterium]
MNRGILIVVGLIVLGLFVLFGSVFTVNQTQQALVLQLGEPVRMIREPGLKFKLPFIQNVTYFDKRILSLDAPPEEIIAADQRRLVVDSFARFRIVDVLKFFQTLGNETVARSRLASQLNSALRRVLGSQDSIAVISGERAQLMTEIARIVNVEAARFGIEIIDVRIKRADYPDTISQAIFRRMQTEREREAKEIRAQGFELSERIRADADRQRTILIAEARRQSETLRGEGDGTRTKIFADAANLDPEFFAFYRSLQAYSHALQTNDTTMLLSPDMEFFRYMTTMPGSAQAK